MSIGDLVTSPLPRSGTLRAGRGWRAFDVDGERQIWHYGAHMASVRENYLHVLLNGAWGSMSDKCGMTKIRNRARIAGLGEVATG
jgi:hypothetical protein